MKNSVARPDDGVHRFFSSAAERILTSLLERPFLESLRVFFKPGHRERRFNLPTMLWLGVFAAAHAAKHSMEAILAEARDALESIAEVPLHAHTLTESGWSRAKQRMSLGLLRRVWRRWVEIARLHAGETALFHGMRLVALDKKSVRVPEALWPVFGSQRSGRRDGPAQAELMVAYEVPVRVPLELTLGKVRTNERVLAYRLLRKLPRPSLLLIDAGFYSIGLFALALQAGHEFLTRMRANGKPKLIRRLGANDGLYEIRASASYWKKKDPTVPARMIVRIVKIHWKGFRPVRLVTSLTDPEVYPMAELVELYHKRWHVETFFRELSSDVEFEHWHTRTLKVLYVELLFHMIYVSVVRTHMAQAAERAGILPGLLSFGRGAEVCIRAWCRLGKHPPTKHKAIHDELLSYLATLTIDVRPGRRFERDTQRRRAKSRRKKLQALKGKRNAA